MAFTDNTFARSSSHANDDAGVLWDYRSTTDNQAAIAGAGYFNAASDRLKVGAVIRALGTDGQTFYQVTAVDAAAGTVTVAAL